MMVKNKYLKVPGGEEGSALAGSGLQVQGSALAESDPWVPTTKKEILTVAN